jgi:hypothetical protein
VTIFTTHFKHSVGIPKQSNKTKEGNTVDSNRERKSQIFPISRWYDPVPERL